MSLSRIGTLVGLELAQRVRSTSWYVLLGTTAVVLLGVTWLALGAVNFEDTLGSFAFSVVVMMVLLLALLVTPALSGNAINGEREQATLAALQVTQARTGEIVLAKLLAAWASGLAFLVVAAPFLLFAGIVGQTPWPVVVISIAIVFLEIGIVAAIGVGLSGIAARPLFSIVTTYLVVMALAVGTLVAFGLGGLALRSEVTVQERYPISYDTATPECGPWEERTEQVARFDGVWWVLAANPFIVLADATPATFSDGYPTDAFGIVSSGVRSAQVAPESEQVFDGCSASYTPPPTPEEVRADTVSAWGVGLALQLVLGAGLLAWGWARTRTPVRRLPRGSRVA